MATRTVTSTIKRSDGSAWKGAVVRFRLASNSYRASPAETYPEGDITATADANGAISVTLISGDAIVYDVTTPDRDTFQIAVPDGSSVALETLRSSYNGAPASIDSVEDAIVSLYGGLPTARGAIVVQEGDSNVVTDLTHLDFDASDFNVTESPTGEANVALAYGTSAGTPAEGNHTHTVSLDGLSDVAITSAASGQNVRYDGSGWVNEYGTGYAVGVIERDSMGDSPSTLTNLAAAATEVGIIRTRRKLDLTNARQIRLTAYTDTVAGSTGSDLYLRYSTNNGGAWTDITNATVTIDATSTWTDSGWVDLPSGAKAFVMIALWSKDGNGSASPTINYAGYQIR